MEFRNAYLLNDETLSFLRYHRLCFVAVDEPQGSISSVLTVAAVTGI